MDKYYSHLKDEEKKFYSLNFFLSEKINVIPMKPIKIMQKKSNDTMHNNEEQSNYLFYKYISRCVNSLDKLNKEKI